MSNRKLPILDAEALMKLDNHVDGDTPLQDVSAAAEDIKKLRINMLFDEYNVGVGTISEQYFLLALAALEQAHRYMEIAAIHVMRKD